MTDRYITVAATERPFTIDAGQSEDLYIPLIPNTAAEAVSGAGAIDPDVYYSTVTTTGADALTLADPSGPAGQLKKIQMIVDGGDGTLTIASPVSASLDVVTFADVGDYVILLWTGSAWRILEAGNAVDGATAPAVA